MNPLFKYHGSKARLAKWYIQRMPSHKTYIELMGGSFAVGLKKPATAISEVYNDVNGDIVNVFKVCREHPEELSTLLRLTPYARDEYFYCLEPTDDPIEKARRFLVRSRMGISSTASAGFRNGVNKEDYSGHALTFSRLPDMVWKLSKRLSRVIIESKDWRMILKKYDMPDVFWFVDPPYLLDVRSSRSIRDGYLHDFTKDEHVDLIEKVKQLRGKVMICHYDHPLYNEMLKDWNKDSCKGFTDSSKRRPTECVWMNYGFDLFTTKQ